MNAIVRRTASTTLVLMLVGAAALMVTGVFGPGRAPETLPATSAAGRVLAADATPQPPAAATVAAAAASAAASAAPTSTTVLPEPPHGGARAGWTPIATTAPPTAPAAAALQKAATQRATTKPAPVKHSPAAAVVVTYHGVNHVWIPALGISKSVQLYPCTSSQPMGLSMYRWGCAGTNNVYLMGHAYAALKPLHDAYVSGTLRIGMRAYYADGAGQIHVYAVVWWRLTLPTTGAAWAWAAQPVPSMTLQTCIGATSQYRLMVRLVEVAG